MTTNLTDKAFIIADNSVGLIALGVEGLTERCVFLVSL